MTILIQEYMQAGKIAGYTYLLENATGEIVAAGYYRFRKHAEWAANKALATFQTN